MQKVAKSAKSVKKCKKCEILEFHEISSHFDKELQGFRANHDLLVILSKNLEIQNTFCKNK